MTNDDCQITNEKNHFGSSVYILHSTFAIRHLQGSTFISAVFILHSTFAIRHFIREE
jgi:hypothetical protein